MARTSQNEAELLGSAHRPIRWLVGALLAASLACAAAVATSFRLGHLQGEAIELVQILEPAMNIAVLVGLGVLALTRLESNWKKRRGLESLHGLRSLAHVIDMHQLTKDANDGRWALPPTASSPERTLSEASLVRYLDYCSELLSMIGKLAALYAQSHKDAALVQSVNEVELLTTNLSRKIWQKIAFIGAGQGREENASRPVSRVL